MTQLRQALLHCKLIKQTLPAALLVICSQAFCQDTTSNPSYIAVKPQTGFIIPHSRTIEDIAGYRPYGLEAEYGWIMTRNQDWEQCNCYSKTGFSLNYVNYNAPELLGSSINLIGYAEPFLNYKGFVLSSLRMGGGVSYLSRVYDRETNPRNLFFSTPVSFLVHLDLNVTKFITDKWFLKAYFKYNHISNGGIKKPNKGMNFPTYGLGVGYALQDFSFPEREKTSLEKPVPVVPALKAFGTLHPTSDEPGHSETAPSFGFMLKARRSISTLNAFNAGLEGSVNYAFREQFRRAGKSTDHHTLAALIGHDFLFGKFMFSQYWGTYLYSPAYGDQTFFQRYSLTYDVYQNLHLGVTMKAHAQVAQAFNVMVGYEFMSDE